MGKVRLEKIGEYAYRKFLAVVGENQCTTAVYIEGRERGGGGGASYGRGVEGENTDVVVVLLSRRCVTEGALFVNFLQFFVQDLWESSCVGKVGV